MSVAFMCRVPAIVQLPPTTIRVAAKSSIYRHNTYSAIVTTMAEHLAETLMNILHGNTDLTIHSCLVINLYFNIYNLFYSYVLFYAISIKHLPNVISLVMFAYDRSCYMTKQFHFPDLSLGIESGRKRRSYAVNL